MSRIDKYLTPELKALYVGALKRAYVENAQRYAESLGDDARIFGTMVSNTGKFFIEGDLAELIHRNGIEVSRPANSFVVQTESCTFHYYKYLENVHSIKFDQSATKAEIAARNQLLLPLYEEFEARSEAIKNADPDAPFLHLVMAHTGDVLRGLHEVWAGAPNGNGRAGASPWAWVECIYRRPDDGEIQIIPGAEPRTPFTSLPMPEVQIRPRESEGQS